jgi:hypothetical protein
MTGITKPRDGSDREPAATHTRSFAVTTVTPSMLRAGPVSKENEPGALCIAFPPRKLATLTVGVT